MKKILLALAGFAAGSAAFCTTNVTLYGIIEEGVLVQNQNIKIQRSSLKARF